MQATDLKGANLSLQQERLWTFLQTSDTYHSQCMVIIQGSLTIATFHLALQETVEQHEILHTVFHTLPGRDIPVQVINSCYPVFCPVVSLENLQPFQQDKQLSFFFEQRLKTRFDLAHGPLLHTTLFRLSSDRHLFLLSLPALCADAATLQHFIAVLGRNYDALSKHQTLADDPLQYIDVSAWQNDLLEAEGAKAPREFWRGSDLLQGQQVKLPFQGVEHSNYQLENAPIFDLKTVSRSLPQTLIRGLKDLEQHYHVSPVAILLACWRVLLWRTTGDTQPLIAVAGNGRIYEELIDAIGLYTRFVPVSAHILPTQTFEQMLLTVHESLEQAMQWQSYFSWPALIDEGQGKASATYFPIAFEYEQWPETIAIGPLSISLWQRSSCIEPCALKLSTLLHGNRLQLELHYDAQHFSTEQGMNLLSLLNTLLQHIVAQPQAKVSTLSLLEASEQERLLTMFQGQNLLINQQAFHQLFEYHAQQTPNQIAIRDTNEQLTYQELNSRANQLARVLRRCGVRPNTIIGLHLPRSSAAIICILAIFKAGGAYVPFDPDSPIERLSYQLQDAQPLFLLTQQGLVSQLSSWDGQVLDVESLRQEAAQEDDSNLLLLNTPEDLAYVIYTSGSTGFPKGVLIRHSSLLNYTQALCKQLDVEYGWQFATVSTLAADLGNTAIFCALASGGCLHILDYATITSAEAFADWAALHPVDVLKIVPSHLSALLAGEPRKEILPRRALVLGGETLSQSLLQQVQTLGAGCKVYNHYGPTETTVGVLINDLGQQYSPANQSEKTEQASVSLGRPIANADAYVLDQWMQPVPGEIVGELYIGGAGVAMGYLHQPAQTAERFVPHPWSRTEGARLYRTGDLVRCQQGQLKFLGRRDNQVKLRGYRIELEEIETALKRHPQIRDGAVILSEGTGREVQLFGYVVPRKQPGPTSQELRDYLRSYVPEYMIPSTFALLKALPLTANGKIDRPQLIRLQKQSHDASITRDAPGRAIKTLLQPRDQEEFQLLRIWEEVLQIQDISITDNFFDLGGHSILAVRLMSQIFKQFGKEIAIATLFQHPTIADLAMLIREEAVVKNQPALVAIQPRGTRPPFFCVHPSGGTVFSYLNLVRFLGTDYPFYGLQTTDLGQLESSVTTIEALASYYLAAIRSIQSEGPYLLGGWSMGGVVAFEMAQQLHRQGHEVALLAIIDSSLADADIRAKAREERIDLADDEMVREMLGHFMLSVPEGFAQYTLEEQINYALTKARERDFIPGDVGFEQVRRILRTVKVHSQMAHLYVGQPYSQRIDYFIANGSMISTNLSCHEEEISQDLEKEDALSPWRKIALGGIEIHQIPGNHREMIEEPHVQALATSLKQCIDRACKEILSRTI